MSEWIKHNGGPMPVSPDTVVDIKCRAGYTERGQANIFGWRTHHSEDGGPYNITEYRIIEEPMKESKTIDQGSLRDDDLRDRYAMAALTGILSSGYNIVDDHHVARKVLSIADAMLAERGKR